MRVTDWKTGSTKTKNDIEKTDEEGRMSSYLRQLAMYAYLIDGVSRGNQSVSEARLIFLEAKSGDKNAIYTRHITQDEIIKLKKDIADYDMLVKSGEWMNRPCTAKVYGGGEVCEYCAMAQKFGVLKKAEK